MRGRRGFTALAAALMLAASPAAPLAAQRQPAPALQPGPVLDTASARAVVEAINGDAAARARWHAAFVSPASPQSREDWLTLLEAMSAAGELTLESARREDGFLQVRVRAPGGVTRRFELAQDPADAARTLRLLALPTPSEPPVAAAPAKLSPRALREAIARRVAFAASLDDFSGVVLVMRGEEVVFHQAVGQAERDFGSPVSPSTRFNLGRMDAMFTAVAIGQLVERRRLSLETPLGEVLPDYPNPAARRATIGQLLAHQAGLGVLADRPGWDRDRRWGQVSDLLPLFAAEPLLFEPGARVQWSDEGYLVLGAVIERVTGRSWYDYVQSEIFAVAGMPQTGHPRLDEIAPGRAVGYRFAERDVLGLGRRGPNWDRLAWRGGPGGGGYSTAADMVAFLRALRGGRLVSVDMANRLTSRGLGFDLRVRGERSLRGAAGGIPFSGVDGDAAMVWETGYAYAVLGNYDAPFAQALADDIGRLLAAQD